MMTQDDVQNLLPDEYKTAFEAALRAAEPYRVDGLLQFRDRYVAVPAMFAGARAKLGLAEDSLEPADDAVNWAVRDALLFVTVSPAGNTQPNHPN